MPLLSDFIELVGEYWYVTVAMCLIVLLFTVAMCILCNRAFAHVRENKNVKSAKKEDYERMETKNKMLAAEKEAVNRAAMEAAASEAEGDEAIGIILSGSYEVKPVASVEEFTDNKEEDMNMAKTSEKKVTEKKAEEKAEEKKTLAPKTKAAEVQPAEDKPEEKKAEEKVVKAVYRVTYDKESKEWLIKKDGATRVIRRCRTKAEALELANQFAENQDLSLSVQKKDGKFQKKTIYTKMLPADKGDKKE